MHSLRQCRTQPHLFFNHLLQVLAFHYHQELQLYLVFQSLNQKSLFQVIAMTYFPNPPLHPTPTHRMCLNHEHIACLLSIETTFQSCLFLLTQLQPLPFYPKWFSCWKQYPNYIVELLLQLTCCGVDTSGDVSSSWLRAVILCQRCPLFIYNKVCDMWLDHMTCGMCYLL